MALSLEQFLIALFIYVHIFYSESGNKNLQPSDTPQSSVKPFYDFVIVGGGSAGCVLANRLSENGAWEILLIEAGGDEDEISDTPLLHPYLHESEKDWNYTTVQQKRACLSRNGICAYPRGRVMGGSSTINAMMYVRGNKADYDGWAEAGNTGWSYEEVLPYFIKSENNTAPILQNSAYHGHEGYQTVGYSRYFSELAPKYIQAGIEFGWQKGDYNGEYQERVDFPQNTMAGPSRASTSKSYLNPIRDRPNLHVVKNAEVSKLISEGNMVQGVEYYRYGEKHKVESTKEVILSAGAINTPKILMLSGIGPVEELNKYNIPQVAELPVGKNLQDHLLLSVYFEINKNITLTTEQWRSEEAIKNYTMKRKGPLTTSGAEVVTFLNILNTTEPPNLLISFYCTGANDKNTINVLLSNVYPESIGSVKLQSGNWQDSPLIDPNYFGENVDFEVFKRGVKLVLDYMKTPTMASMSPRLYTEAYKTCPEYQFKDFDDYIGCIVEGYTGSIYHPVSTAKMGPLDSKNSVVTPELLVKGFSNLRVIDASVMPRIVRGTTNAPTIMIAEKGADYIKSYYA